MENLLVLVLNQETIYFKPLLEVQDEHPNLYAETLSLFKEDDLETRANFYYLGRISPAMEGADITNAYVVIVDTADLQQEADFIRIAELEDLWKSDDAYDALIMSKILKNVYNQEFPVRY